MNQRDLGGCRGRDLGRGQGRMWGRKAAGPGGYCRCPQCGLKFEHMIGKPCYEKKCPKCDIQMERE